MNVDVLIRPDTPDGIPITYTTTNRDGVFKVSGLERRKYSVSAAVPAHIPKYPDTGPVVFKDGEVVTLVLMKGGVVTGTVTDAKGEATPVTRADITKTRPTIEESIESTACRRELTSCPPTGVSKIAPIE
jgi:hypothetical protein